MAPKPKQANRRANAKPKARTSVATEVAAPLDYQTVLGKVRSAPEPTAEDCSSAGVLFDHFPAGERKDNLRAWCGCLHGDGVCKKKTFVYVVTNADALGVVSSRGGKMVEEVCVSALAPATVAVSPAVPAVASV